MHSLVAVFAAIVAVLSCGCSSSETNSPPAPADGGCGVPILGDPSKPIEFDFRALRADGTDAPLAEGGDLALMFPPQGGRVAFVGVRATNLDPCAVTLTGALRDPVTRQVRVDKRTVNLIASGDGWGTSAPAAQSVFAARETYANVPLCPNQWASTDVFDHPFVLEVTVQDASKRQVTKTLNVVPRCAEADKVVECKCICKVGYVLGEACGADDAGIVDAGAGG